MFTLVSTGMLWAQDRFIASDEQNWDIPLPAHIAKGSIKQNKTELTDLSVGLNSYAPQGKVRSMAEWENIQSLMVSWVAFKDVLAEIVAAAKKECEVLIVCRDKNLARLELEEKGIDCNHNITFLETQVNTVWVRDYGPQSIYVDGSLAFVDWQYNRPRPADDQLSYAVAKHYQRECYGSQDSEAILFTGGNFITDGKGTAFSSKLILEENEMPSRVPVMMKQYMGIEELITLDTLQYDVIHHLDMHMKLLDEETLLIGQYPEGVSDGPIIEKNVAYIKEHLETPTGNPYKIIRIPMPPDQMGAYPDQMGFYRNYTNAVFVNKSILVPIYNSSYDRIALDIWKASMPDYKIIPIDANDLIEAGGALHCVTKEIGAY